MKKIDYLILTDQNRWEGTGKQATEDELKEDIAEIKERLKSEGREDEQLLVFTADSMSWRFGT